MGTITIGDTPPALQPVPETPLEDAEVYVWDAYAAAWLGTAPRDMFLNVPAGTYRLVIHFATDGTSSLHNTAEIQAAGTRCKFSYGSDSSTTEVYSSRTFYIVSTTAGTWTIKSAAGSNTGSILRPTVTMLRLYRGGS